MSKYGRHFARKQAEVRLSFHRRNQTEVRSSPVVDLAVIEEIKQKLDLALSKFAEIDKLKHKIKDLQEEDSLQESLKNAHAEIDNLKEQSKAEGKAIEELKKGVKELKRNANSEKGRAIKLESHSRRNNRNFFDIPEQSKEDSFAKTVPEKGT